MADKVRLFTGTGFPRVFYLRNHGYSLFFPVWALAVYARLKNGRATIQDMVRVKLLEQSFWCRHITC